MWLKSQLLTFRTRAPISSASNIDCLNKQNSFCYCKNDYRGHRLTGALYVPKVCKSRKTKSSDCAIYVKCCYIIPNLLEWWNVARTIWFWQYLTRFYNIENRKNWNFFDCYTLLSTGSKMEFESRCIVSQKTFFECVIYSTWTEVLDRWLFFEAKLP